MNKKMNEKEELTTSLINAVINNDATLVNKLLSQGANPNVSVDAAQVTPLHFAAQNNALQVIPLLIEAGANIDAQTEPDGLTPLEIAITHGHSKVIQMLTAYSNQSDGKAH